MKDTILHYAAYKEDEALVLYLISKKADPY